MGMIGFIIRGIDASVTQFGIGKGHHLSQVAGICHDFLIAGHTGIKDDFSDRRPGRPKRKSGVRRSIREDEERGLSSIKGKHDGIPGIAKWVRQTNKLRPTNKLRQTNETKPKYYCMLDSRPFAKSIRLNFRKIGENKDRNSILNPQE